MIRAATSRLWRKRRPIPAIVAAALTSGVVAVAFGATERAVSLAVFGEGHGVPQVSPPEAFQRAEWKLVYLLGFAVASTTGIGVCFAATPWLYVCRKPRIAAAVLMVRYGKSSGR